LRNSRILFITTWIDRNTLKIFVSRLFHETNGFAPGRLSLGDFQYRSGSELFQATGDGSILGEVIGLAAKNDWTLVPSFDLSAAPGPMVSDEVVATALRHLDEDLPNALQEGLDGVFLILHGAMVSESHDDVEGLLLSRVAYHLRDHRIPVAAVLDLHANVSPAMAEHANILVAYRCNPHTDAVEAGLRAVDLLIESIGNRTEFRTGLVEVPVIFPPTGTASATEPMRGLLAIARRHECAQLPGISVCPGFALADTAFTGLTFQLVAEHSESGRAAAHLAATELSAHARAHAGQGFPEEWSLDAAISDGKLRSDFPTLIVEPADNIGGGSPGDATWVLEKFIDHEIQGAGVILAAPEAVRMLQSHPVGEEVAVTMGGKHPSMSGPALTLHVRILRHGNGTFDVEDKHSHIVSMRGTRIEMGPSTLVETRGITILLTTYPTAPMDLGQWRCMGVNPEEFRWIDIKAAVAHRQAYDRLSARSYSVSTPGPCTSDLTTLPYRKIRRPMFPFDALPENPPSIYAL